MLFDIADINHYLYLLAKEYRKLNGQNSKTEIILVGDASIIINYGFLESTAKIDSIIPDPVSLLPLIDKVGDENGLTPGWINEDYKNTVSYSPELVKYSTSYKLICDCLQVKTISAEYLLATKIRTFSDSRQDIINIAGIINDHYERSLPFDFQMIESAYRKLYKEDIPKETADRVKEFFSYENYEDLEEFFYGIIEVTDKNED